MRRESVEGRVHSRAISHQTKRIRLVLERVTVVERDKDARRGGRLALVIVPGRSVPGQTDEHLCVAAQPVHHELGMVIL